MNTPPATVSDTEMSAKRTNASIGSVMPDSKRPRTSHKAPGEGIAAYLVCHSFSLSLTLSLLRYLHDRLYDTWNNNNWYNYYGYEHTYFSTRSRTRTRGQRSHDGLGLSWCRHSWQSQIETLVLTCLVHIDTSSTRRMQDTCYWCWWSWLWNTQEFSLDRLQGDPCHWYGHDRP